MLQVNCYSVTKKDKIANFKFFFKSSHGTEPNYIIFPIGQNLHTYLWHSGTKSRTTFTHTYCGTQLCPRIDSILASILAEFVSSMTSKQWFQIEVGSELAMHFFISSLDFKLWFVPIEANSESVYKMLFRNENTPQYTPNSNPR